MSALSQREATSFPSPMTSFYRSQWASIAATVVDFGLLAGLVEWFGVDYVVATALGAVAGGVTNFLIGRYWSFEAGDGRWDRQARRYFLVSAGSAVLNTVLVYAVTEWAGAHYMVSKVVTALAVGWFYNFPLQRVYVFGRNA